MSDHSAATFPAEMSTSLIYFSCLVFCVVARNFRSDYNYEYYEDDNQDKWNDNQVWNDSNYDYVWRDHGERIGQPCFQKYKVIRGGIFVQRKEASHCGGQSAGSGQRGRYTLRGTRWRQKANILIPLLINCPSDPTWRQVLRCQVVDIKQHTRGGVGRLGACWRIMQ